jgi:hypothetical protein
MTTDRKGRVSGLALGANPLAFQAIPAASLGQSYPKHYPQPLGANAPAPEASSRNPLGAPLSIREVASMIGCSAWTVRQRHVPAGLPYFRSGPNGKLVFFRDQVITWILQQQQRKGGRR